jgi:hypothetical protein
MQTKSKEYLGVATLMAMPHDGEYVAMGVMLAIPTTDGEPLTPDNVGKRLTANEPPYVLDMRYLGDISKDEATEGTQMGGSSIYLLDVQPLIPIPAFVVEEMGVRLDRIGMSPADDLPDLPDEVFRPTL